MNDPVRVEQIPVEFVNYHYENHTKVKSNWRFNHCIQSV
ncbi:MAG: hypothetical protein ACJAV5_001350 [Vicingaceae bacterium]|jgi:hypothetical protein